MLQTSANVFAIAALFLASGFFIREGIIQWMRVFRITRKILNPYKRGLHDGQMLERRRERDG